MRMPVASKIALPTAAATMRQMPSTMARQAARKPGLAVLHEGILQGRQAFGNVIKYLLMGTSSAFGSVTLRRRPVRKRAASS